MIEPHWLDEYGNMLLQMRQSMTAFLPRLAAALFILALGLAAAYLAKLISSRSKAQKSIRHSNHTRFFMTSNSGESFMVRSMGSNMSNWRATTLTNHTRDSITLCGWKRKATKTGEDISMTGTGTPG